MYLVLAKILYPLVVDNFHKFGTRKNLLLLCIGNLSFRVTWHFENYIAISRREFDKL